LIIGVNGVIAVSSTKIDAHAEQQVSIIQRMIHAPRDLAFRTIADPLPISKWWAPSRLITSVHKVVVMPGGTWRFLQRYKEAKESAFHGVCHDVVIPVQTVYTMGYQEMPGHATLNIDSHEEQAGLPA
jgi:uncharacterized protein YndB with AHSA1/START domain